MTTTPSEVAIDYQLARLIPAPARKLGWGWRFLKVEWAGYGSGGDGPWHIPWTRWSVELWGPGVETSMEWAIGSNEPEPLLRPDELVMGEIVATSRDKLVDLCREAVERLHLGDVQPE